MSNAVLVVAFVILLAANSARAEAPAVAVDIAPLHSLVTQVMGMRGTPELIVPTGASPHNHALRPSEAQALQTADIVFLISDELTPSLADRIDTLAPDAVRMEMMAISGTTVLPFRQSPLFEGQNSATHEEGHEEGQEEGHEEGHDHGELDPHAWLDPSNAVVWLDAIAVALSKLDPQFASTYSANAESGKKELMTLVTDVEGMLAPVRDRSFIVFHDAYQYFEVAFRFHASGAISLSDASKPAPARIRKIHDLVDDAGISCVLAEPQFNSDLVATVLDGTAARSSVMDPLGSHLQPGPDLYYELVRELGETLADCL